MPLRPTNDPIIEAIAQRVRSIVARLPACDLATLASTVGVPDEAFCGLFEESRCTGDARLLIDVVAALACDTGVDPTWLLTGHYDGAIHRKVLLLGEDRTAEGMRRLREFVREQYRHLRDDAWSFPLFGRLFRP
jgi:hypothetical protein